MWAPGTLDWLSWWNARGFKAVYANACSEHPIDYDMHCLHCIWYHRNWDEVHIMQLEAMEFAATE